MPGSLGEAVLDLSADSSQLEKDVANSKSGVLSVLSGLGTLGGQIFMAGMAAVIAGGVVIGKALKESVEEAMAAELVQSQLNAVLESTGGIAGVTAEEVNGLADAYSNLTMFDDEAIVSAESLLLTFTNIGSDVFPQATETILDMSQALGQDLQSSTIQLGKALQDPILGVTALRRVGVNFNEEQQELIKTLVESGKLEEAQALILQELQTEFGGAAEAAGKTFAGQMAIMDTKMGNIKETIGMALLPVLSDLATMLGDYLNKPETKQFIEDLAQTIADFAVSAAEKLPAFIEGVGKVFAWIEENGETIKNVLLGVGAAIAAFATGSVIAGLVGTITTLAGVFTAAGGGIAGIVAILGGPVTLIIGAIALAVGLFAVAWKNNWGGIQEKTAAVWAWLQPILQNIWNWLQVNIPIALQALATFWTTTLLPAIQTVWAWITGTLIPALQEVWNWLATNVPAAIQTLSTWWTNLSNTARAAWSLIQTAISLAISKIVAKVGEIMSYFRFFLEVANRVKEFIMSKLTVAWDGLQKAIAKIAAVIQRVISGLQELGSAIPAWLIPGSPTPFEIGLLGINDAMKAMSRARLPELGGAFSSSLAVNPASLNGLADGAGSGRQYVFNMQRSDLNEDQLRRALQRAEVLYG